MEISVLISRLQELGFPRKQAECYARLAKAGPSPAGGLARSAPMSRPEVYKSIRELVERGYARTIVGRPMRFVATPASEVFRDLADAARSRLALVESAEQTLAGELAAAPSLAVELPGFDFVVSRRRILLRLAKMIDAATRDIKMVAVHPQLFHLFEASGTWGRLAAGANRGVRIRVVAAVKVTQMPSLVRLVRDGLEFGLMFEPDAMGTVIVDDRQVLTLLQADISSRKPDKGNSSAYWSDSPALVRLQSRLFDAQWKDCPKVSTMAGGPTATESVVVES